jgi:hypothetical protein
MRLAAIGVAREVNIKMHFEWDVMIWTESV